MHACVGVFSSISGVTSRTCIRVDGKVRMHSECLLIGDFLLKITFFMRKENNDLHFRIVTLKVHEFVNMCHEGIYAFSTEFWAL